MEIFYFLICGRGDWSKQRLKALLKYRPIFEYVVKKAEVGKTSAGIHPPVIPFFVPSALIGNPCFISGSPIRPVPARFWRGAFGDDKIGVIPADYSTQPFEYRLQLESSPIPLVLLDRLVLDGIYRGNVRDQALLGIHAFLSGSPIKVLGDDKPSGSLTSLVPARLWWRWIPDY